MRSLAFRSAAVAARRSLVAALALASLGACRDATAPTTSVAGRYVATTYLTGTTSADARDLIALGGADTLSLAEGGKAAETVVIPAPLMGDYGGTIESTFLWSQQGETVTIIDPFAEPGYSASAYTARGDSLTAEETRGGAYVKIVLHRVR